MISGEIEVSLLAWIRLISEEKIGGNLAPLTSHQFDELISQFFT